MSVEPSQEAQDVNWRKLHALGLPSGSVRAVLALLVFATVWMLLLLRPSAEVPDYIRDLLFIIMGHYFAARRRAESAPEPGPPPLFLPNGSVRVVLVAGCVAVAVMLFRRGQLTNLEKNPGAVTLLLVGGFLLGVALNALTGWLARGRRPPRILEDMRALVSLVAGAALVALILNRLYVMIPPERIDGLFGRQLRFGRFGPENLLAAVVGFYFGSRS
jgi:hypothetical protein